MDQALVAMIRRSTSMERGVGYNLMARSDDVGWGIVGLLMASQGLVMCYACRICHGLKVA